MAKMYTPAMERVKKKRRNGKRGQANSPLQQAWKRLKRNKSALVGMALLGFMVLVAIFANFIAPYSYIEQDYMAMKQFPSSAHWFGTDALGRDIFCRCVYGARVSLMISLVAVLTSIVTGGLVGTISGYMGGKADNLIMRFIDVLQSIPTVLFALSITAVLGDGLWQLIVAITISFFGGAARNFRTAILTVKSGEFVSASKAINIGKFQMILRHLVPNAVGLISIYVIFMFAAGIIVVSSLSYIGIGIEPPTADWGGILTQGKGYFLTHPYMVLFPTLCIMVTVFGLNLLGNGLRDALDPRLN